MLFLQDTANLFVEENKAILFWKRKVLKITWNGKNFDQKMFQIWLHQKVIEIEVLSQYPMTSVEMKFHKKIVTSGWRMFLNGFQCKLYMQ